ncbi:type II toxin-antitoxin system RelE/ParE family toxin [Streptococcus sobrinus]|uniref:type II toxin-antitoxin system RelE/ParE family toxin n=1 Tax=Streptococcus sobrinus TaxID=1310 RepID=UPI0002DF86AC|nr:type II toxin-antitoxin system RelE/ParE family toxin [Streptococcus sobrinus]AWN18343.1 type II toxin-antitoxin system RelE/ParE family toxin [Streptococcus sobrinus]
MTKENYQLRFLPLFEKDLNAIVDYISQSLQNPRAAHDLLNAVERADTRLARPLAFPAYPSLNERRHPYYYIRVRNFIIFYVVLGNTMEVRRILYSKRNFEDLL